MRDYIKRTLSLLFGSILILDSLWLLLQKKIHLGTVLPLLIGTGLIIYATSFNQLQQWYQSSRIKTYLWQTLWIGFFIWLFTVFIFFTFIYYSTLTQTKSSSSSSSHAILVLGSGIENGKPSPTLKNRLDAAALYAKDYPHAVIIMTGGLGFKEKQTEAEIMAQYITSHYPKLINPIQLEDQSTSTKLNLEHSQKILNHLNIHLDEPIAIVTSDFHSLRARAIAKHQGYKQIINIHATTPLYLRYNAWLREYFAYISGYILREY